MQERNPFGYAGYGLGRTEGPNTIAASIGGVGNEKIEAEAPGAGLNQGPNELRAHSADEQAATLYGSAVVVQTGYGDIWFGTLEAPIQSITGDHGWALALSLRNARKCADGGLAALAIAGPRPDDAVSGRIDLVHLAMVQAVAAPTHQAIAAWLEAAAYNIPTDVELRRQNLAAFGRRL